jgi:hypothetical protein
MLKNSVPGNCVMAASHFRLSGSQAGASPARPRAGWLDLGHCCLGLHKLSERCCRKKIKRQLPVAGEASGEVAVRA